MIRAVIVAGAVAAAALSPQSASAQPGPVEPGPMYFDRPGHYDNDVPGMDYNAHLTGPCPNKDVFTFGRGPGGEPLQCRWVRDQWPPVPTDTGFWQATYDLRGVQNIGAPCPSPQSAAQAPDGRPLVCLGDQGWQAGFFTRLGFTPA